MKLINKLIVKIIQEIKKPSESPPKLMKTSNSVSLRTSFQTLLYSHVDIIKSLNSGDLTIPPSVTSKLIADSSVFAQEIVDNGEKIWLEDFRWYRNKIEVGQPPKSSVLCMLFCVERFIKCHWEVACKVIQAKENTESFLDEYGTRWISYSDLIMSMEEEFSFVESLINSIYDDPIIKKDRVTKEFIPKYSILRMMCRVWGKYVMKKVIPLFIGKIEVILSQYHEKIKDFALNFSDFAHSKSIATTVKNRWSLDMIMRELIIQSVQMIVDISLNEISIHFIESSEATFSKFYSQIEGVILNSCEKMYDEIRGWVSPKTFNLISNAHYREIKGIFPIWTQRKLMELVTAKSVAACEDRIRKYYTEFVTSTSGHDSKEGYQKLKDENPMWKRQSKLKDPNFFKLIFGEQEKERIFISIKHIVRDFESGIELMPIDDSDMDSISDDEEVKIDSSYKNVCLNCLHLNLNSDSFISPWLQIQILPIFKFLYLAII